MAMGSFKTLRKEIFVTFTVLLLSCLAEGNCGSLDRIGVATRLIQMLYPGTGGTEVSFEISGGATDARNFVIVLRELEAGVRAGNPARDPGKEVLEFPLYFDFNFVKGGEVACRPIVFRRNGDDKVFEETVANINAHPELTDSEVLDLAKRRGLRFDGSKKVAVLKNLPWHRLESIYGKLRFKTAVFNITSEHEKSAKYSFGQLWWNITAEEVGTTRTLGIFVEPFRGRIDALSEMDRRDFKK
jgi:hypothetical protein